MVYCLGKKTLLISLNCYDNHAGRIPPKLVIIS
jgi:hypothetical protein